MTLLIRLLVSEWVVRRPCTRRLAEAAGMWARNEGKVSYLSLLGKRRLARPHFCGSVNTPQAPALTVSSVR